MGNNRERGVSMDFARASSAAEKEGGELNYQEFLSAKKITITPSGFEPQNINPILFDFQRDIVRWACKKGKSCIFAGTGLGKTFMQVEWARLVHEHTGLNGIIVAPLAVSSQTVLEAKKIGVTVNLCKEPSDIRPGINITNYERLDKFADIDFGFVVLDESSILKNYAGAMRNTIIDRFAATPYKLACSATPAPNDYMELGNHSEFVGVMARSEMLAMFFTHDGGDTAKWRVKGHAKRRFWEWVAGWAVMVTKPSDLGYENGEFDLPPLRIHQITVDSEPINSLFAVEALSLQERQQARKSSIEDRVQACADIVAAYPSAAWLIWCNLNQESTMLTKATGATEVTGSDSPETKETRIDGFSNGTIKKIVSKPSICGMGMNWQHCNKVAFVGLSDSFEEYYQAVRRCWRFGQKYPVDVYVITSEAEGAVVDNIKRKEHDFELMLSGMISATQEITKINLRGTRQEKTEYAAAQEMRLPEWLGVT